MESSLKHQPQKRRHDNRIMSVYTRGLQTRPVILPFSAINKNIKENIEENIKSTIEGKCVSQGFIKPSSTKILSYSAGTIDRGSNITFEVVFECDVCFPVEGMLMSCVVKNITKAGIRAEIANEFPSPVTVFILRDQQIAALSGFTDVKEGDIINVRVIGQRFELNDVYISVIGKLVKEKEFQKQPRLVFKN
jgi:DNA-directed RNA polymerase subunit E'/Rpb7